MRIEPLDPADRAAVAEVVRLWQDAYRVDYPDDPPFCPQWERGRITHPLPSEPSEYHLAYEGADLVGVLELSWPQRDNVTTGLLEIVVRPQARRRGVGTALLGVTRQRMDRMGRKLLVFMTPAEGPGAGFARAIDAERGLVEARRRLVVEDQTMALADRLLSQAMPYAAGYSLASWRDDTPEEYLDGIAYLTGRMSTDAPLDDLAWEAEAFDSDRIRERDAVPAARGRRAYTTAAIHDATARVAGFTQLCFDPCNASDAWQWDTIVDPEHRGHRLGTVVKAANHRFVRRHEPRLHTITTWNATSNKHMIAINEAMGFQPFDLWCDWQLRI
jgi:GNAT superfamily N-acetyltransferase